MHRSYLPTIIRICLFISTTAEAATTSRDSEITQQIEEIIVALSKTPPTALVVLVVLAALAFGAFAIHAIVKIVLREK
jgi:hypothetical protein